jgi:hypothetical protein
MNLLDYLPQPPLAAKARPRLTAEHKTAILAALADNDWTTVREAYGWAWNTLGIRVTYVTFWRFIDAKGLLVGDTLCSRRLQMA